MELEPRFENGKSLLIAGLREHVKTVFKHPRAVAAGVSLQNPKPGR